MRKYITYVLIGNDLGAFSMYSDLYKATKEAKEYGQKFDTYSCVCVINADNDYVTLNPNELETIWENAT